MYLTGRGTFFLMFCRVCKSFLRCSDVIEIFKFLLLFTGPASQWHWRADSTLEMRTHAIQHPSSTQLQTIQRDNILDSTHTPRRWIQTWTTGFLQYRSPGTNSIDDCRMTSDVFHQMYPAVDQHLLDRHNIVADNQHSARGPTRLFKQPGVPRTNTFIYTRWVLYTISLYFFDGDYDIGVTGLRAT